MRPGGIQVGIQLNQLRVGVEDRLCPQARGALDEPPKILVLTGSLALLGHLISQVADALIQRAGAGDGNLQIGVIVQQVRTGGDVMRQRVDDFQHALVRIGRHLFAAGVLNRADLVAQHLHLLL